MNTVNLGRIALAATAIGAGIGAHALLDDASPGVSTAASVGAGVGVAVGLGAMATRLGLEFVVFPRIVVGPPTLVSRLGAFGAAGAAGALAGAVIAHARSRD